MITSRCIPVVCLCNILTIISPILSIHPYDGSHQFRQRYSVRRLCSCRCVTNNFVSFISARTFSLFASYKRPPPDVYDIYPPPPSCQDQQAPEGESTTKSALRQHQLKVSALESDKLDSDSERLESDPSHATDSVRTASSQSSTGDCGMVVAIADVATAGRTTDRSNDAGSSEEDFVRTADGTETGQSSVGCAGLSEGPCQDGEGVDERHVQEQAGAAELRRRRDAS